MVLKLLQYQTDVFFMFFFILRVDQYIIDFHHNKLDLILHKVCVLQIHVVGQDFNQSKIHHCLIVRTIPQNEGRRRNVTFSYLHLILSRSKIDLGEHTRTTMLIKQIINPRQRAIVLDGNLIQSTIIHVHLLGTILLQDENYRGSPLG
jgi:hypothetical protein